MTIEELLSTRSSQLYLGNKYILHAYFSSIQPRVGCFMAWLSLFANRVVLSKILLKPLHCKFELVEMSEHNWEHIKSCS
jgi:hypothetical protein